MLYEFIPMVEGLERIEQKRRLTALEVILSLDELDVTDIGY